MLKIIVFSFFSIATLNAQEITIDSISKAAITKNIKFNYKQLAIPRVLIGYGLIGIESDQLKVLILKSNRK